MNPNLETAGPTTGPLLHCLAIDHETRVIAIVGAGGKTSLMYALAREMVSLGRTVVTTTTTKIYPPRPAESPHLLLLEHDPLLNSLSGLLAKFSHVTVGDRVDTKTGKLQGATEDIVDACATAAQCVLVEADGAAAHPVKAPAAWEPVIPHCTDLVIPVVGLDCLGKPARREIVFRLGEFLTVTGLEEGEEITPQAIARLVTHSQGGMKGVTEGVQVIPLLNKMDLVPRALVEETAQAILKAAPGKIHRVAAGTLKGKNQVTAFANVPPPE